MSQDHLFRNIDDLKEYLKSDKFQEDSLLNMLKGSAKCNEYYSLPLQSDYVIAIYNNYNDYNEIVSPSNYVPVLIQSLALPLSNGITMTMDKFGLQSADFSAQNKLSFEFVGLPYVPKTGSHLTAEESVFTSIIRFYYSQRFTQSGVLKVKRKSDLLPAVFVINTRTNNIVYVMKDCVFSYPTFTTSPSSNALATYKTDVTFSSYREFMHDDLSKHNKSETELKDLSNL